MLFVLTKAAIANRVYNDFAVDRFNVVRSGDSQ